MAEHSVNRLFIGADIARTENLDISYSSSQNLAEGEVFVTDKYGDLLSSGSTISDSDVIYVGVGTDQTFDVTQPDGTEVTGLREIKWSSRIDGNYVREYSGLNADASATEKQYTIDLESATSFAPVEGEEYVIRAVFTDVTEHPGQFVQDYRVVASSTATADLVDDFVAEINSYKPSRVIADEDGSNDLRITARDLSDDSKDAIDEYRQVDFRLFLKSDNFDDVAITKVQDAHPGNGNPKLVRDKEKQALGYLGVTNTWYFPVKSPGLDVNMDKWYDAIVIQHNSPYLAADNQYNKQFQQTTEIYIPDGAGQTDTAPTSGYDAVLNVLNPWMNSLPRAFDSVSFS